MHKQHNHTKRIVRERSEECALNIQKLTGKYGIKLMQSFKLSQYIINTYLFVIMIVVVVQTATTCLGCSYSEFFV